MQCVWERMKNELFCSSLVITVKHIRKKPYASLTYYPSEFGNNLEPQTGL